MPSGSRSAAINLHKFVAVLVEDVLVELVDEAPEAPVENQSDYRSILLRQRGLLQQMLAFVCPVATVSALKRCPSEVEDPMLGTTVRTIDKLSLGL